LHGVGPTLLPEEPDPTNGGGAGPCAF